MNPAQAKQLLDKYEQGTASPDDVKLIENWYAAISREQNLDATEADFWQMKALIWADTLKNTGLDEEPKVKVQRLWPRIAVVAAAVAAIVFGVWFYNAHDMNGRHPELVSGSTYKNDIAPGRNIATITLPNGKTITLSDAKTGVVVGGNSMKYNDGSNVDTLSSLRGGTTRQPHTNDEIASIPRNDVIASTPTGGTYQFTLPDGTHVWLNAASKISFPSQFSGTNRKILLSGEAYFEVAKDKTKPFIVESNGQKVTVLGTHFNINAYKDEGNTKTTLLEGSVKVSVSSLPTLSLQGGTMRQPHDEIVLKPNQQASLIGGNEIIVTPADIEQELSWKNGYFRFNQQGIQDIMRKLSRWYNIDVLYQGKITTEKFTGTVSRDKNISEALLMLEQTKGVHFKIEGRQVTVIP